jgi:hypothetical protein
MVGVVLSRVDKGSHAFTTAVAIKEGGKWKQVRPHLANGHPLSAGYLGMGTHELNDGWKPGRIVVFDEMAPADPNAVFPENRIIKPRVTIGEKLTRSQMRAAVKGVTHPTIVALFPNLQQRLDKVAYLCGGEEHLRSMGFVRCKEVWFTSGGDAHVCIDDTQLVCKVRCRWVAQKLREGILTTTRATPRPLLRFAALKDLDSDHYDPPRYHVALTGMR